MKKGKTRSVCVVIVDDDRDMLFVLKSQLKREGYEVYTNVEGEDILQQLELKKADIVLLDLSMNMVNGSELCKQIKKKHTLNGTKVLIMSGNHDIENAARDCGADGFIAKPLTIDEVTAVLEKHMV